MLFFCNDIEVGISLGAEGVSLLLFHTPPSLLSLYHTPPAAVKFVSYAPGPTGHPLYLRGGAVSLPSNAERLVVEWRANSPSKIEGVAAELARQTGAYDHFADSVICANIYIVAKVFIPTRLYYFLTGKKLIPTRTDFFASEFQLTRDLKIIESRFNFF